MTPPPEKTEATTFSESESQNRLLDSEVREMVSALTRRLSDLRNQHHKNHPPSSRKFHDRQNHSSDIDDDNSQVRVITMAGSNTGATMHGEMTNDKSSLTSGTKKMDPTPGSYVNSNFQAINNSIMMGGSYSSNDPGVHIDVTDYEPERHHVVGPTMKHRGLAKRDNKEDGASKSDHPSEPNSD